VGLVGVIFIGGSRERRGVVVAVLFFLLITAALAWFELRYNTFVPQHTGNVRIVSYIPIAYAILLAAGVDVVCRPAMRSLKKPQPIWLSVTSGVVVVALAIGFFAASTVPIMASRPAVSTTGAQALAELRKEAPSGSVVVSNVATRGTLEYFTGLEAPTEGRQPLIEDPRTLASAAQYLLSMHRFLRHPRPGQLQHDLGATWLVLVNPPDELGTRLNYGRPRSGLARKAGLEAVWRRDGVGIFKVPGAGTAVESVGHRKTLWQGYLVALLVVGVVVGLASVGLSRVDRRVRQSRGDV
jgi:hypothetical protein